MPSILLCIIKIISRPGANLKNERKNDENVCFESRFTTSNNSRITYLKFTKYQCTSVLHTTRPHTCMTIKLQFVPLNCLFRKIDIFFAETNVKNLMKTEIKQY